MKKHSLFLFISYIHFCWCWWSWSSSCWRMKMWHLRNLTLLLWLRLLLSWLKLLISSLLLLLLLCILWMMLLWTSNWTTTKNNKKKIDTKTFDLVIRNKKELMNNFSMKSTETLNWKEIQQQWTKRVELRSNITIVINSELGLNYAWLKNFSTRIIFFVLNIWWQWIINWAMCFFCQLTIVDPFVVDYFVVVDLIVGWLLKHY